MTDLQSGKDGREVNMSNLMDQIQNLLAQFVVGKEVNADIC